jgi:AraC-like DNA-binding protein
MFGSTLAEIFSAPDYNCRLEGSHDKPNFAVTRLRSGPRPAEKAPARPADDALLICVSLSPTAMGQWRACYNVAPGYELREAFFIEDLLVAQLTRSILSPVRHGEPLVKLALEQVAMLLGAHVLQRYFRAPKVGSSARRGLEKAQAATRSADTARGGMAFGRLRRIREHIERELAHKISLGELANIAGLSPGHFSRAFKQSVGMPPHRYVLRRRIATAADAIRNTDRSLAEVALSVGFSDQSHFTRVFARELGETPSAFRRKYR